MRGVLAAAILLPSIWGHSGLDPTINRSACTLYRYKVADIPGAHDKFHIYVEIKSCDLTYDLVSGFVPYPMEEFHAAP